MKKILLAAALGAAVIFTGCGAYGSYELSVENSELTVYTEPPETAPELQIYTEAPETTAAAKTDSPNKNKETVTEAATEEETFGDYSSDTYVEYHFRSKKLLNQHFEKHGGEFGEEFGYETAEDYEKGASDVINNPEALHKTEKEDGDYVYYIEATNEFVILSTDGYIRTYFLPSAGKKYYDRQ